MQTINYWSFYHGIRALKNCPKIVCLDILNIFKFFKIYVVFPPTYPYFIKELNTVYKPVHVRSTA